MLKKSTSGVLASFRSSTYRSVRLRLFARCGLPVEWRVLARRGWAGEKSGLIERPAGMYSSWSRCASHRSSTVLNSFRSLLRSTPR